MPCPECFSEDIEEVEVNFDDPNHHIERYQCNECGVVYEWDSRRTIIESDEKEDEEYDKRMKELAEKRKKLQAIEEENDYEDGE